MQTVYKTELISLYCTNERNRKFALKAESIKLSAALDFAKPGSTKDSDKYSRDADAFRYDKMSCEAENQRVGRLLKLKDIIPMLVKCE